MSAKTLKSEVVAAAVATSGCGPEGVEVVEGAEVEQAFGRLGIYCPAAGDGRERRGVARARSAATVDGLARRRPIKVELVRADALVTEAEARVSARPKPRGAGSRGRGASGAHGRRHPAVCAWGRPRTPSRPWPERRRGFDTVEEARAAMLPAESLAALAAEVEAYQAAYAAALAVCQQLEELRRTGRSRAVDRFLAVRRPRGSKDLGSTRACGALVRRPPTNSARGRFPPCACLYERAARLPRAAFWSA